MCKLNILFVLPDARIGGGQVNCIRLANYLADFHNVYIANARLNLYDIELVETISAQVKMFEGRIYTKSNKSSSPNQVDWPRIDAFHKLLEIFDISYVFSQVWWADKFTYDFLKDSCREILWVSRMCGCYEFLLRQPRFEEFYLDDIMLVMNRINALSFVADKNLEIFDACGIRKPPRVEKIYNGLNVNGLHLEPRYRVNKSKKDFIVCLCSRAIVEKGWLEAIEAINGINASAENTEIGVRVKLVLIGDGPLFREIRPSDSRYIIYAGCQSDPISIMRQCHLGLLPSRFAGESLPTVIIEYLSCGLPVVATNVGSIADMITTNDSQAGVLLPACDGRILSDYIKDAILGYILDKEMYLDHANVARSIFAERFDIKHTARRYLNIFLKDETY